jgi:hypothetical protein
MKLTPVERLSKPLTGKFLPKNSQKLCKETLGFSQTRSTLDAFAGQMIETTAGLWLYIRHDPNRHIQLSTNRVVFLFSFGFKNKKICSIYSTNDRGLSPSKSLNFKYLYLFVLLSKDRSRRDICKELSMSIQPLERFRWILWVKSIKKSASRDRDPMACDTLGVLNNVSLLYHG